MTREPVEPPASRYVFDPGSVPAAEDLVGVGADLEPGTLLAAYRAGIFPMGLGRHGRGPIGWWSPDPRGVLATGELRITRSLRRSVRRYEIRVDTAFEQVVAGCAAPERTGRWITTRLAAAYAGLHELGWAHSVECWCGDRLVGGLYGVAIGGLFAGESMFHTERDASKVALVALVRLLDADARAGRLLDVQWRTDHLASLGVREISRQRYLALLGTALSLPAPPALTPARPAPGPG